MTGRATGINIKDYYHYEPLDPDQPQLIEQPIVVNGKHMHVFSWTDNKTTGECPPWVRCNWCGKRADRCQEGRDD